MAETQRPQEGEFFFMPPHGVVMAHYPEATKDSIFKGHGDALFVSVQPNPTAVPITDKSLNRLHPVPANEEIIPALEEAQKSPAPIFAINVNYLDNLLKSQDLIKVAKAANPANSNASNPAYAKAATHAFKIFASIRFYHNCIATLDPENAQELITTIARKDEHREKYVVVGEDVVNDAARIYDAQKDKVKASSKAPSKPRRATPPSESSEKIAKPSENSFVYLPGFGATMVHDYKPSKKSRFGGGARSLFASTIPRKPSHKIDRDSLEQMVDMPSKETLEEALEIASTFQPELGLDKDQIDDLLRSNDIRDVAKVIAFTHDKLSRVITF